MPRVVFVHEKKSILTAEGVTILEAARRAGVVIESPCNGSGTCDKCLVTVQGQGQVLACRELVASDIAVETPDYASENATMEILVTGKSVDYGLNPYIRKTLAGMPGSYRAEVYAGAALLGTEPLEDEDAAHFRGSTRELNAMPLYGIALDIGTTTMAAALYDLATGEQMDTESELNPQTAYGQDVLSRIHFASKRATADVPDGINPGLKTLFTIFIDALNSMIETLATRCGIEQRHIYEIVFSGNTAMLHLATQTDPYLLGQFPYTPAISGGSCLDAASLGVAIAPFGIVYLPPIISAYVGADITSGILASALAEAQGTVLFIDIGTNGEMALARDGTLVAASTAAGPALEGMNISCGMRASRGAIESFVVDRDDFSFKTIGGADPVGICGSGLIDIAGELVKAGIIGPNGRFAVPSTEKESPLWKALRTHEGKRAFFITDAIYLSQNDVRQIQLAKSAIRTGIESLLAHLALSPGDIAQVDLAGSFGYHLKERSLINIGLLPKEFAGKVHFIGNTSLFGAAAFLLNQDLMQQALALVTRIEVVELVQEKDFDLTFIGYMGF